MTLQDQQRIDLLMFAVDPRMRGMPLSFVDPSLMRTPLEEHTFHVVANAGEALRQVHRHEPRLLMAWVTREHLLSVTALIDALRRRRPELPLLAITPESDADVERAVRAAGAGYYFALDGNADPPLLRQTLAALRASSARASPSERPPPRVAMSRIRGRPPAVYRSP